MALCSSHFRRAITPLCSFTIHSRRISSACAPWRFSSSCLRPINSLTSLTPSLSSRIQGVDAQFRLLQLTPISLYSSKFYDENKFDEITEDTILFEGCDYNHWLITMEFPKDPEPTAEEKVETFVQTLAKGLGISVDEAKKKMYACSTTTFTGFQAVMTEEESKKFEGMPGVVFVLPDSYIDPVNKEYGGDKYDNGVITPRPPPIQWGRRGGGRYNDRNRNDDNMRYRQGPMQNQQGGSTYDNRGYPGGRNYGAPQQQSYKPQQSYGPPQQSYGPPQQGYGSPQPSYGSSQQNYVPPQQSYSSPQPSQQTYPSSHGQGQQSYGYTQGNYVPQKNYNPTPQSYGFPQQNYTNTPPQQNYTNTPPQQNYSSPPPNYGSQTQNYGPGQTASGRVEYSPPMNTRNPASVVQNLYKEDFKGPMPSGGDAVNVAYGGGDGAPYPHGAGSMRSDMGGSQGFPQFRTGMQGDEKSAVPVGDTSPAQGRY